MLKIINGASLEWSEGGAAVAGAAFRRVVVGHGAALTIASVGEAVGGDAALYEVVIHSLGAALAEELVVLVAGRQFTARMVMQENETVTVTEKSAL